MGTLFAQGVEPPHSPHTGDMAQQLSARPLTQPLPQRLPLDHPRRAEILARHEAAMASGLAGYPDPDTGLFVITARTHADRGRCCGNGCRHCPYA